MLHTVSGEQRSAALDSQLPVAKALKLGRCSCHDSLPKRHNANYQSFLVPKHCPAPLKHDTTHPVASCAGEYAASPKQALLWSYSSKLVEKHGKTTPNRVDWFNWFVWFYCLIWFQTVGTPLLKTFPKSRSCRRHGKKLAAHLQSAVASWAQGHELNSVHQVRQCANPFAHGKNILIPKLTSKTPDFTYQSLQEYVWGESGCDWV